MEEEQRARTTGEVTVVADDPAKVTIATSLTSARPYYWAPASTPSGIAHGTDLFDVAQRAGAPWRWDDEAVRTLAVMRHLTGEQTLHRDVRRLPPGAVLRARRGTVEIARTDALTPALDDDAGTVGDVVAALLEIVAELPERPLLALTAGLDSRLLLAALLRCGQRPILWTAGPPDSPDVLVASSIARATGLEHHTIELESAAYLPHARAITRATGGAYLAGDWHSRFLFAGAEALGAPVVVKGTNGELARSFYADLRGARLADRLPGGLVRARFAFTVLRGRAAFPAPPRLLDGTSRMPADLAALCDAPRRPLDRLDHFYALQRIRHFCGMGVRLADDAIPVAAPLLDARWSLAVARLPRRWKLGGALHHAAIARLAPDLLRHPLAGGAPAAARWQGRDTTVAYAPFDDVLQDPALHERIRHSRHLGRFATREERARAIDHRDRTLLELLLTLHETAEAAAERQPAAISTTPVSAAATPTA